jgi:hypothetical protein
MLSFKGSRIKLGLSKHEKGPHILKRSCDERSISLHACIKGMKNKLGLLVKSRV